MEINIVKSQNYGDWRLARLSFVRFWRHVYLDACKYRILARLMSRLLRHKDELLNPTQWNFFRSAIPYVFLYPAADER